MRHLSANLYERFKLPSGLVIPAEGVFDRYSRETALRYACNSRNELCLSDAFKLIQRFASNDIRAPRGLEAVVYCSGMRGTGKEAEWTAIWRKLLSPTDATFRSQIINALGCSDDRDLLKQLLESSVGAGNPASYTQAERRAVLGAVLSSRSGLEVVIEFITTFELDILRDYGYVSLETLLTIPARTIRNSNQRIMFISFLDSLTQLDAAGFRRLVTISGESLLLQQRPENADFMAMVEQFLSSLNQESTTTTSTSTTPPTTRPPTQAPTAPPTTRPPTQAPTTETTTLGAATIGVKLVTLLSSLAIVFHFRV